MTVPLMVLAVLSVVGGALNLPHLVGGHETMKHFLATASDGVNAEHMHLDATTEWTLMGITVALIAVVIVLAWNRFGKRATLDAEPEQLPLLQRLIARKWLLDELYAYLFERPYTWLSDHFSSIGERTLMGPMVAGAGRGTQQLGDLLRRVQTGNMSVYLFGMVVGIIVLLAWTLSNV